MLAKTFEWVRATNPTPSDDLVTKRRAAAGALVTKIDDDGNLLLEMTAAAVAGLRPSYSQDSDLVTVVLEAIRTEQPAFPESLTENELDLRITCAIAVGEVLKVATDANALPDDSLLLSASLITAGLHSQVTSTERFIREMLSDLRSIAANMLAKAGLLKRTRWNGRSYIDGIKEAADVPTFWKAALPQFQKAFDTLSNNAVKDREELNLLWWFFNRYSKTADSLYPALSVNEAILCMGLELGDISMLPHWPHIPSLAERLLSDGRPGPALADQAFKEIAKDWNAKEVAAFLPEHDSAKEFVRTHAAILPVSWGALHQFENGSQAWVTELKKVSGWDPKKNISPFLLVEQIYNERIAQRLLTKCFE